jgi:hypothetical protein
LPFPNRIRKDATLFAHERNELINRKAAGAD